MLAVLWAWTGIAYQWAFFSAINKAAFGFGVVFLLGAAAFLWLGVAKGRLAFATTSHSRRVLGWVLVADAIVIYPLLTVLLGHGCPVMPTFGLPCPTTLYTIGMFRLHQSERAVIWRSSQTPEHPVPDAAGQLR